MSDIIIYDNNKYNMIDMRFAGRTIYVLLFHIGILRDWSLITGRVGYKTGGGGI